MGAIKKYTGFLAWILIPAYLLILSNTVINRHSHVLHNGYVIYHSHPVSKHETGKPFNPHKHSTGEFFIFQNLCIHQFKIEPGLVYSFYNNRYIRIASENYQPDFYVEPRTNQYLRAPPCFS